MILNTEFWEALNVSQRRKFAKANCEATYKKAITYQIFAAVLGVLVIGLFLPVADKARRFLKGYYSLREEEMPVAVKILCVLDFLFGLVANLIIMFVRDEDDYGIFVNTLTRRKLEEMLNESENETVTVPNGADPFRISNFSTASRRPEPKPVPQGCEKMPAAVMIFIDVAIIVIAAILFSMLFSGCSGKRSDKPVVPSNLSASDESELPASSELTVDDFGELTVYPSSWSANIPMRVTSSSGLKLRKGPTTDDEIIAVMPDKSAVTVLNQSDVGKWYFVAYELEGKTVYGWACVKQGDDTYMVPADSKSTDASSSVSSKSEGTLSASKLKEMSAGHIQAVLDIENGFVGYIKANTDKSMLFGSEEVGETFYLASNVKGSNDIYNYLSKYMLTNKAQEKSKLPAVDSNESVPANPVVSYNGSVYISEDPGTVYMADMGTFSVLSSSENSYIVVVNASDDENNTIKLTVNMQYTDEKLKITTYSVS